MSGDLGTINTSLVIMAVVSVLEALVLLAMGIGGFVMYRRMMTLVDDLEARQIAPLRARVDGILADVKAVTARVSHESERVDHAINGTLERVDETAERVKSSVRLKMNQTIAIIRGVRAAIVSFLHTEHRPKPPATAAGRL
jgi:hypothetical protein